MGKKLRLLAVMPSLLGFVWSGGVFADVWKTFHSDEGRFRLEMPGEPQHTQSGEKTFLGAVTNHLFSVHVLSQEFTVEYSDLPHLALALGGPRTILKKAKEGLLQDVQGEELTFRLFTDKGQEHAELAYIGRSDTEASHIVPATFTVQRAPSR